MIVPAFVAGRDQTFSDGSALRRTSTSALCRLRDIPLDYGAEPSMCVGAAERAVEWEGPGMEVTTCLEALSKRLIEASAIAKAAVTCAHSGSEREAVRIALDLDALLHEAQTLHGAMCVIGRMNREGDSKSAS